MKNDERYSARCGWVSDLGTFQSAEPSQVTRSLGNFVKDAGDAQYRAWRQSIPWLQRQCGAYIHNWAPAEGHHTILEYQLPRDFRRPDVVFLRNGSVVVLEIKGYPAVSQAALDQVFAYARDLRAYHRSCQGRSVVPVLVTKGAPEEPDRVDDVFVVRPEHVGELLLRLDDSSTREIDLPQQFLDDDAYAPLPTIVQAARALFEKRSLPWIEKARANTEPALAAISEIAHRAAETKTRHLVLLTGVPGAGKTLVGLQLVHAGWIDDLAVDRGDGKPSAAAVYLSGNGPLVQVLQHALAERSSGGRTFVQPIKNYVDSFFRRPGRVPPEHLIVFDEAQRAHDADRAAQVHRVAESPSEPAHLLEFCSRIPGWSVLVGLVGTGQAIHVGEEGGTPLWAQALMERKDCQEWTVHCPPFESAAFEGVGCALEAQDTLNLDTEIRFHLTPRLHQFVDGMLSDESSARLDVSGQELYGAGYRFLVSRSLDTAKDYLRERYADAPEARYGMLASSKDKWLLNFNVDNTFQTTKRLRVGPWYNSPANDPMSCCRLETVATEFSSQGLELDAAILAWGSDFLWNGRQWHMQNSRGSRGYIQDPLGMRRNVYRVLLTRGRDATVVYVPEDGRWDATHERLLSVGFRSLDLGRNR